MHEIDTRDSPPICQPPRWVPFFLWPKISRMVEDMVEESKSSWACPVVLVKKKDGDSLHEVLCWLLITECSHLEGCFFRCQWPIAHPKKRYLELIQSIMGSKCSFLLGRWTYWNLPVTSTCIKGRKHIFAFQLIQHVINSPMIQCLMQQTLRGVGEYCSVYIEGSQIVPWSSGLLPPVCAKL